MGNPVGLTGREYKLLLEPGIFSGGPNERAANAFWKHHLHPVVALHADQQSGSKSRSGGNFAIAGQRIIRYWDAGENFLDQQDFNLRERIDVDDGICADTCDMTLKFRTPDILLAAAFHARAKRGNREMKFEEDIAPLQVARTKRSGKRVVAVPEPRASYSRFAVSIDRQAERPPATLAKAVSLYPVLKGELGQTTGVRNWHLQPGHTFCEWIFRGVKADIGKAKAVFTLTLWYRAKGADEGAHERVVAKGATPAIAEISFTIGAARALKPASARRAAQLFVAMQEMLPVNHEATSKTELALPG